MDYDVVLSDKCIKRGSKFAIAFAWDEIEDTNNVPEIIFAACPYKGPSIERLSWMYGALMVVGGAYARLYATARGQLHKLKTEMN